MGNWLSDVIKWRPFYISSVVIAALVLLTYFFFPILSIILFFALLALWSRIPCMTNTITKDLEMIDFFSVIIALNVSAFAGAFFAGGMLVFSHFFSTIERPRYAIYDSIALFVAALVTPLLYSYFNQNLLFTMYAFSVVRYIVRAIIAIPMWGGETPGLLPIVFINIGLAYLTNTVYVFVFGKYMNALFEKGLHIHWSIFAIIAVILIFIGGKKLLEKQITQFEDNATKAKPTSQIS